MQLTPDQISQFWSPLREAILQSLPPTATVGPTSGNDLLKSLLTGNAQCWVLYDMSGGRAAIAAVATTCVQTEMLTGSRYVLITSLYGYRQLPKTVWFYGLDTLRTFAKGNDCRLVLAYTTSDLVKTLAGDLDAQLENVVVRWEV